MALIVGVRLRLEQTNKQTIKVNSIVDNLVPNVDCSLFVDDYTIYTSSLNETS